MASAAGKPVLGKKSLSAFATTNLDEMLRVAGIGQLIIAGVATSGTVLSTTRVLPAARISELGGSPG